MYTSIHVLGERNCGTNYLLQLLKQNVHIPIFDTELVHKHFIFDKNIIEKHPNTLFLVITKELHHFLKALYNAPHHVVGVPLNEQGISSYEHTNISMLSFLKSKIQSDIRFTDTRDDVKYKYANSYELNENPVKLYYNKLLFYLSLRVNKFQNVDYIKYEELNKNPNILIDILKIYDIPTIHNHIENISFYKSNKNIKYVPTKYHVFNESELILIENLKEQAINKLLLQYNIDNLKFDYESKYYINDYVTHNNFTNDTNISIPKIIHFIWIGSKIPVKYILSVKSCQQINPSWEIWLWIDDHNSNSNNFDDDTVKLKHVNDLELIAKDSYDFIQNYGFKADILRMEIVNAFGGIYSDIDSMWVKPLSQLFEYEFVNFRMDFRLNNISNSLFGFSKNNIILQTILSNMKLHLDNCETVVGKRKDFVPVFSGPCLFTYVIDKYFKNCYRMNFINQSFCMLGGLHQNYESCYRHYGNYQDIIFTYQTFDGNW